MDWYDCLCGFRHPWPAGQRACPNRGLTHEGVLRGKIKVGRPRVEADSVMGRPWEEEGISRALWFRRQKEQREKS
jgi:hypothetical protein